MSVKIGIDTDTGTVFLASTDGALTHTVNMDIKNARLVASMITAAANVLEQDKQKQIEAYRDAQDYV